MASPDGNPERGGSNLASRSTRPSFFRSGWGGLATFPAGIVMLAWVIVASRPTDAGNATHSMSAPGPFPVAHRDMVLVDASRPTAPNGRFPGLPTRTLKTRVWYPARPRRLEPLRLGPPPLAEAEHRFPLVIYSHGFMSFRTEGRYLARHLASHGYIVAAANFPLTTYFAPGGPMLADVIEQPRDVSFLIDSMLRLNADEESPLAGRIDPTRVVAMGLSLGGMTTILATFHPWLLDPRIGAAISIAGPSSMFGPAFYARGTTPFMALAGDIDAIVDYRANAAVLVDRVPGATLVTFRGGTHVGFVGLASLFFGWMKNPDRIGCAAIERHLPKSPAFLEPLGGADVGIITPDTPVLCREPLPKAMKPRRQHILTTAAVHAFLESHLAEEIGTRDRARLFLLETFARENDDVRVEVSPL